jgi:DNA modification methylase
VKTIHIDQILISDDRQRKEFDPDTLEELRIDIEEHGLFNAVVLRPELTPLDAPDQWTLVQGERRLRAMRDIISLGGRIRHDGEECPEGHVPFTTLGELDPLKAQIAELHENLKRANLTWQEEAAATQRIMQLRSALAAEAQEPAPTTVDIMREIADVPKDATSTTFPTAHTKVRDQLAVARHLDDPDVKAAKTLKDAFKTLKRKEEAKRNEETAKAMGTTFSAASHKIFNADAYEWLLACAPNQFDVIVTDPPYGMGADEFGDSDGKAAGAHGYEDSEAVARECYYNLAFRGYEAAKEQAHLYAFCDIDAFPWAREMLKNAGWWVHRTPLIWHKPNGSRVPWPEHGPQRKYELILYAVKGKKPVTGIYPDVISVPTEPNLGNSAQKPVALYLELLKRSARPGDSVLDCFAGTGPLLRAAHEMKCIATLVEKDPAQYGIILGRAKELK